MSEISTTTVVTTTPLVTVVSSRMSSPSSVTMAPSLTRLPATLVQCDVVLPPPLTPSCPWGVIGPCLCTTAATSIPAVSSGLCQLCHGFSTGRFLSQSWACHHFVYYMFGVCSSVCFLLSGAILDVIFTPRGSTIGVCTVATIGVYLWQAYVQPADHQPMPGMHRVAAPFTTLSRGAFCCSVSCSPAIPSIWWGIQLWGLGRESPDPSLFSARWGGVFFSRLGSIWRHGWFWICD